MNKHIALRYKLLRIAQEDDLIDQRMKSTELEFKDQAKGLFSEFCKSNESKEANLFVGMQKLVNRKRSYIPQA